MRRQTDITHCGRGHEFTPQNTIIKATGFRTCRACRHLTEADRRREARERLGVPSRPKTLSERLAARIRVDDETGCHVWFGTINHHGYGRITAPSDWAKTKIATHRAAWVLANGPIPIGLELDHLCRNRSCCNPAHLELVTHRENVARGDAPPAHRSRQSHCKRGHPLAGDNLVPRKDGHRECRKCRTMRWPAATDPQSQHSDGEG